MDDKQKDLEELRWRLEARKAGAPRAEAPVRRRPARALDRKWLCVPVLAVLLFAAISFGVHRAGTAGGPVSQPPEAPVEPAVQEPVEPSAPPDQTQGAVPEEPPSEQTQEPVSPDGPEDAGLVEPQEPEVDHTGQKWATLCDGTVVYENDYKDPFEIWPERVSDPNPWSRVYLCSSYTGTVVDEIVVDYTQHAGHEVLEGNPVRSVRYGSNVIVGDFLTGTGYSSLDEIESMRGISGPYVGEDGYGRMPRFYRLHGSPTPVNLSKPVLAYLDPLLWIESNCSDCKGRSDFMINGVSMFDLDAVIGVLGMPVGGVGGRFVDPEYFDVSEGYFDGYMWDMGKAGFLVINFANKDFMVTLSLYDAMNTIFFP